jgi:hypothetical protein
LVIERRLTTRMKRVSVEHETVQQALEVDFVPALEPEVVDCKESSVEAVDDC